jgi:diguanylate cyclase (GGDEF)-like protein/PAS domain S-box-containing protein
VWADVRDQASTTAECTGMTGTESAGQWPAWRAATARAWSLIAAATSDVALPHAELVDELGRLLDVLTERLRGDPDDVGSARTVGEELVRLNIVGDDALRRGMQLLGSALTAGPPAVPPERTSGLLAGVAAGYARALQQRTLITQETISRALLRAKDEVERVLHTSEERFGAIFSASAVGIVISELDGIIVQHNAALRDMLGSRDQDLTGHNLFDLFAPAVLAGVRASYRRVRNGEIRRARRPAQLVDGDGEIVWTVLSVSLLRDSDGRPLHFLTMVDNVSDLHLLAENVTRQGSHDQLTGLPNRQFLANRLAELTTRSDPPILITLCHIDLDRLSLINNGLGWAVGDAMLRVVAGRLRRAFTEPGTILARIGGDEFAVLSTRDRTAEGDADLLALIRAINQTLAEPVDVGDQRIAVSASIGITRRVSAEVTAEELLREAEATVWRLKSRDKVQWGLYDQHQDALDRTRARLAAAMPAALAEGEIDTRFQPLVRLTDRAVAAVEARVEWPHTELGAQDHDQCLALAEETTLAVTLGGWLLAAACRQATRWSAELGARAPAVMVNLTARQANDPDLIAMVTQVVADNEVELDRLRIGLPVAEVTRPGSDAEDNMRVLDELGVPLVLHGAGAGDLYLIDDGVPVHGVVLADAMLRRLGRQPDTETLSARSVAQLVALLRSRGLFVVVRGVSTVEQEDWLRDIGVDLAQGERFGGAYRPAGGPVPSSVGTEGNK